MEKAKRKKLGRRILSFVLTATLVVGLVPGNVLTASAEESSATAPSVTAFATPEQLMNSDNFALHTDYAGVAQKVYFGTNGSKKQTWYIAGSDADNSIVLLCDPALPMGKDFFLSADNYYNENNVKLNKSMYDGASVYANHYGASDLRRLLQGYTGEENTEKFSAAEKGMMQTTRVYTEDAKKKDDEKAEYTYYTEDVLYAAYGDFDDNDKNYITVGANSADSLNGGLKVSLTSAPYNSVDIFWLRTPYCFNRGSDYALRVNYDGYVNSNVVSVNNNVVPTFRLNLSSVLFASAAPAATSGASLTDTMTLRLDGAETENGKITSKAYYATDSVVVDASDSETVYLYVQGKDGTTDWVYSQEVSVDSIIVTDTIMSGAKDSSGQAVSLTSVDLSRCKIWLEKKVAEDNLVYAVMAKESETITTVAVTDITAPVVGGELDEAAICNTTGVSTTTPAVGYTKNGTSVSGNANYLADYTAVVELEAEDGYTFTDETTATVNGNDARVSFDVGTGKLTVSYTFDKTAKLPLGNAYYVTKEELMNSFDLDGSEDAVGKVYFGTNGTGDGAVSQSWYIAGSDADNSIVLLCDPMLPLATGKVFEDSTANKTYDDNWGCTYDSAPSEVRANHYGASDFRLTTLKGLETGAFTETEQSMMLETTVYTNDRTDSNYSTTDTLYAAYGEYNGGYITVGANSAENLNGGLKVSLSSPPYNKNNLPFWLRTRYYNHYGSAQAVSGSYTTARNVNETYAVVPAFRLNLSSVLFASAAPAATSGASLTDTMTFRVDGAQTENEKITSKATYTVDDVMVDVSESETVYLYVQGNDGTTDWVYSQEISEDSTIATETIKSGAKDSSGQSVSPASIDLIRCKVWLEKEEDNLVYAVMAKWLDTVIAVTDVTDITAPVAGAELDVVATCNTRGVSTTTPTVSYTRNGESVSGNARYQVSHTAVVELEAEEGYVFTDETTATINGNEASVSFDAGTGKLTVSYTFDKTAKLPLGNAYYVTKEELMGSFELDGTDDTVGKVYFGTNGSNKQTWYIAGSDAEDSVVLLCDPVLPMAGEVFLKSENCYLYYLDAYNRKDYLCLNNSTYNGASVYANHYGASDLRRVLQGYTGEENTERFSAAEKELMQTTRVYTVDNKQKDDRSAEYTYYTEDVLYAAYGDYDDYSYITVGANNADSLNGGLKVSLTSAPFNGGNEIIFWLRAPYYDDSNSNRGSGTALTAELQDDGEWVYRGGVEYVRLVVPAFRLNLSSVLFASAAPAATSGASLTDTMTLRLDGAETENEKITSKAYYATDSVMVDVADSETVYLYVQDADRVYSVEITEDTTVALTSMTGIDNLTDESTKIWLEKSEDNVAYAVMAEYHENHVDADSDGYCDKCYKVSNGIGVNLAGHSVSLGGQIGMNFYMDLDDSLLADGEAHMLFTLPGEEEPVKVYVKDVKNSSVNIGGKTYYVFTRNVAAKDMADTITAKIVCGDGSEGTEYTYSVKDYAEDVMDKYGESSNEYKLAKAMLNYGAYAQKYFDPNVAPEKLANEGCAYEAGEFTVTTSGMKNYVPTVTDESEILDYVGSTLILEADIKVRHYFKLTNETALDSLNGLTLYTAQQGNPVEGTYYYYESSGITAAALGDMSTPYTGVEGISIKYCPLSYVTTVLANENADLGNDTALQNLMKALYLYYKATVAPNNQS